MSEQSITIKLRVTPELHHKIKDASSQLKRSMNAEMVARLEQSFSASSATSSAIEAANMSLATYRTILLQLVETTNDIKLLKKVLSQTFEVTLVPVSEENKVLEGLKQGDHISVETLAKLIPNKKPTE